MQILRGGRPKDVFLTAVSLAVAAVPEGLPAVVTIALALGLQRMARRNALIRRLPSVETLGSVTVICSDKTGTLTRNEMTVVEIHASGERYDVTGAGYLPEGQFLQDSQTIDARQVAGLRQALLIGARCNHARLVRVAEDDWDVVGDPTEGALRIAAVKAGLDSADSRAEMRVVHEIPFDADRKAMSVVVQEPGGAVVMYTKGAPEVLLANCEAELRADGRIESLSDARRKEIFQTSEAIAARAMRVLALAYREYATPSPSADGVYEERGLIFSGLAGMLDPPRDEARHAVRTCRQAGIRPVMITGDHPATALAIAREVGITSDGDPGAAELTGAQLDRLSDEELIERAERTRVFARVSPEHKLRIVRALRSRGHIVAMTGDGVNDAPAVQAADIGIAMGITGADVTKEASDMVLTDDNFATIVNAVEEGRGIHENILKFVHYLLASNTSELLFMFFAALVGWPLPLLAIHILWINLVSDSLPALALGTEPPERGVMSRPPRPLNEPIVGLRRGLRILLHGCLLAVAAAVGFAWFYRDDPANLDTARTAAFCILVYSQLFYAFACRSFSETMPSLGFWSNPRLLGGIAVASLLQLAVVFMPLTRDVFKTHGDLSPAAWLLVFGLALVPVTAIEVTKLVRRRTSTHKS
jgi:Ca2+-transporting ATPase